VSTIYVQKSATVTPKVCPRGGDSTIEESAIVALATVLALMLMFLVLAI
jgi:hypothetical protein